MKQRIVTAVLGIPLLLVFVWFEVSQFPLITLLVAFFSALGVVELYRLASLSGARPLVLFGVIWSVLFVVNAHLDATYEVDYIAPLLLASAVVLPLVWLLIFSREGAFLTWSWTLLGILYLGWMLSHYVSIRELDNGREWVILVLFTTFACDTGAFFVGRAWGRRSLAPRISPGKTWEGAIGGFIAAGAAAVIIYAIIDAADPTLPLSYAQVLVIGCLVGVLAQIGDLFESLLKRRAGVKDSGKSIPGHGGILDRVDSLVFTGLVVYYYLLWVVE